MIYRVSVANSSLRLVVILQVKKRINLMKSGINRACHASELLNMGGSTTWEEGTNLLTNKLVET